MRRFDRQLEPTFWARYEQRWLAKAPKGSADPLRWKHARRTLASRFHELVRPSGEPRNCAYCDGPLGAESRETIDHFVPVEVCDGLALTWTNLYPACDGCNSGAKGARWSCWLVRPDADPVDEWVEFDEQTGRLEPSPEIGRRDRARVRLTIAVLGLNAKARCVQRKRLLSELQARWRLGDHDYLRDALLRGPYRFVAVKFAASKKRVSPLI